MKVGKVPYARRIFNLSAEKFDIRLVSLGLDYPNPNDFTAPRPREVRSAEETGTRKNATNFVLHLVFHSSSAGIKILCLLYVPP